MRAPLVLAATVVLRVAAYPLNPPPVDARRSPWQATVCFVDVGMSTYSLGEVATLINAAVIACPNTTTSQDKAVCSAILGNCMAALMYVLSYGASALSDCANTTYITTYEPTCAADITGFINGLVTAWGASSSLASGTCQNVSGIPTIALEGQRRLQSRPGFTAEEAQAAMAAAERLQRRLGARKPRREVDVRKLPAYEQYKFLRGHVPDYDQLVRDLSEQRSEQDLYEEHRIRDTDISFCVFDVGQATFYLTRAIANLHYTVQNCVPRKLRNSIGSMTCTVNLAGMLGAMLYVMLYITFTTTQCPALNNDQALCAADIISCMTVFTSLIGSAADLELSCGNLDKASDDVSIPHEGIHVITPNRRLVRGNPAVPQRFV